MQPVKLIERAASTAVHTVRHPISSVAYAAGIARGLAGAAVHGALVKGHDPEAGPAPVPTQRKEPTAAGSPSEAPSGPREPQRVPKPVPPPDAQFDTIVIEATDEEPGEAFATEPKAVSRESNHGGGPATDAEIDAWIDEAMQGLETGPDVDIETPVGTTGAEPGHNPDTAEADLQQPDTPPLLDPATTKAILSESETLRKAADPDKG
jgi:hypothetical protein